jgi:hypothetical protein
MGICVAAIGAFVVAIDRASSGGAGACAELCAELFELFEKFGLLGLFEFCGFDEFVVGGVGVVVVVVVAGVVNLALAGDMSIPVAVAAAVAAAAAAAAMALSSEGTGAAPVRCTTSTLDISTLFPISRPVSSDLYCHCSVWLGHSDSVP